MTNDDLITKKTRSWFVSGLLSGGTPLRLAWLMVVLFFICVTHLAVVAESATATNVSVPFEIRWPLVDPEQKEIPNTGPLLTGIFHTWATGTEATNVVLKIEITLTRPQRESQRQFWNKALAFPEYDWMRYVRVWDTNNQWLWPNLPYLLRLYGRERIERYGGWDPGKDVDNDFAAILIRKYDATGERESGDTQRRPLVSAEWHPVEVTQTDRRTIVHNACSDQFSVHLARDAGTRSGRILVWLIYADFLGIPIPRNWPKEPEHDGGILNFFQIDWDYNVGQGLVSNVKQNVPSRSTGFDWRRWVARYSVTDQVRGNRRLTD